MRDDVGGSTLASHTHNYLTVPCSLLHLDEETLIVAAISEYGHPDAEDAILGQEQRCQSN